MPAGEAEEGSIILLAENKAEKRNRTYSSFHRRGRGEGIKRLFGIFLDFTDDISREVVNSKGLVTAMAGVEKMRAFIIRFLYVLIWAGLVFCALRYVMPAIMPFVVALGIAFALKPLINKISTGTRLNRKLVAVLVLSVVYVLFAILLVFMGVRLIGYLSGVFSGLPQFYGNTIEPALSDVSKWFDEFFIRLDPNVSSFIEAAGDSISEAVKSLVVSISTGAVDALKNIVLSVPLLVVRFVLTVIASYFFVVDYYTIVNFLAKQLPESAGRKMVIVRDYIINVLLSFGKAYFILMSITFVEVSIGLLILRRPNAIPIALLVAAMDILPILGTGTVILPWAAYSFIVGDFFTGIGLLIMYAVVTVVRQTLEPRVVGKQIGLYPLLTLICMFIGARYFGFWGLLGFPVVLAVLVYLNRSGEIKLFKGLEPEDEPGHEEGENDKKPMIDAEAGSPKGKKKKAGRKRP